MSRADREAIDWIESIAGHPEFSSAYRKPDVTANRGPQPTMRDSSADLARGLDFQELETIPMEFEALLAFSEGRKF